MEQREERGLGKHIVYLIGMLILGGVTFSIAASVGLNLAVKKAEERDSRSSATSHASDAKTPAESEAKPHDAAPEGD